MIRIDIDLADTVAEVRELGIRLEDSGEINAAIALVTENALKKYGRETAPSQHATANRLGARPTNHLVDAYEQIESQSDRSSARLLIPRASRLRAAFGGYVQTPGAGKQFLTIPVAAEAYGKRAGEFTDLVFMRVGPKQTPILARPNEDGSITTYYFLAREVEIPEDPDLIPFEDLEATARDGAELYILTGELFEG
jgi:hypothetical protein